MKLYFEDVDFVQASKRLKIKYTLYSFVAEPIRIALIDTSIFGIPFEGIDSYQNGVGCMKGEIAKFIKTGDLVYFDGNNIEIKYDVMS